MFQWRKTKTKKITPENPKSPMTMSLRCCTDVMFSKYASAKKNAVQAKNARTPTKTENPHTLLSPLYQQVPM